ncbi:MAG: DUF4340 domain-containing protein [Chloroflexi bacterium]|nr:DUF4340 domain-containing protein [Chloroflexota bacterium]
MSYKTTLILLAILVAVGLGVYWQDIRPGPKKEEAKPTQVFNFKSNDVNALDVTYQGKTTELHKESESQWKLKKPEESDADYWNVEGMVARLGTLNANRVLTETTGNLADYGLNQPIAEATIGLADGKQSKFIVGDKSPDGSAYYVKRDDSDTIFLVSTSFISDVVKLATNPPKAKPTPTPAPPTATPAPAQATPTPAQATPAPAGATPSPAGQ